MNINPNDIVKVKLTESGRRVVLKRHHETCISLLDSTYTTVDLEPPEIDPDGWLTGSFWSIMSNFNDCWAMGLIPPFSELVKAE